jgi:hypothetical protein
LCRAPNLPLFTIPARDLSSHDRIPRRAKDKKNDHEYQKGPSEVADEERRSDHKRNQKHQKIRYEVFFCYLPLAEMFRSPFGEKHAAQPALPKGTGPAIIIAVHAVPLHEPEFKQENEPYRTTQMMPIWYRIAAPIRYIEIESRFDPSTIQAG